MNATRDQLAATSAKASSSLPSSSVAYAAASRSSASANRPDWTRTVPARLSTRAA
jgi:hypothetical protein